MQHYKTFTDVCYNIYTLYIYVYRDELFGTSDSKKAPSSSNKKTTNKPKTVPSVKSNVSKAAASTPIVRPPTDYENKQKKEVKKEKFLFLNEI